MEGGRFNVLRLLRSSGACARIGAAGNVAVEFALTLPVLMLLMLGSAEMARFVILHQKVDRVAVTTSDLVARAETIKESDLEDIFDAADLVAQPFDLASLGVVIVSAVTNDDGSGPTIAWQRTGAGTASHTSQIGTEGGSANLSADFEVREGETAIIAEVFYDFEPFLSELIVEPQTLYRRAHHRPRLGTLEQIDAG
ncbi:MAG TPA: TadE/TadG family type IV pilus assembly protein [Geminicoccaceae bacterium]|nr:TadE/TadG family type IV pilus assembly protein [Geminicoccaceae bacterium]